VDNKKFSIQSKNVLLSSHDEISARTIVIENGIVIAIEPFGFESDSVIDFGDAFITPGIVDTHAHINEPGRTDWEGFKTATRAAAAGGITTVIDMPLNSIPPTTTLENYITKKYEAKNKCTIDYGFWGGVIPGNEKELEGMIMGGVLGFKCFLIDSGVTEFPQSTLDTLEVAMPILAKHNVPLLVHAELEGPAHITNTNHTKYLSYLESRPQKWEVDAIRFIIELSKKTKCKVHIVHLSAADALTDIESAKRDGVQITVETCPHYLHFNSENILDGATQFKCAPPIREKSNQDRLWDGLRSGLIDFIVSDHSPCTPNLKLMEIGSFDKAWGGISGLQFSMPVVWTEMKNRDFKLQDLIRLMSENTAKRAQLYPKKGSLKPGADADFIVWKPNELTKVTENMIEHKHKVTPYQGETLYGQILKTFVRGHCVYDQGNFQNETIGENVR
jgi:allantoinase